MSIVERLSAAFRAEFGFAVYGGAEPDGEAAARAYLFHRQAGKPATEALRLARLDVAERVSRWPYRFGLSRAGKRTEDGARWIDRPDLAGFRFVGFADQLAPNRVRHNGWYLDDTGESDVARGVVYQMPARGGRAVYVEGIQVGESRGGAWRERSTNLPAEVAPAGLYLDSLHYGVAGDEDNEEAKAEAAHGADSEAESYAEAECEHNERMRHDDENDDDENDDDENDDDETDDDETDDESSPWRIVTATAPDSWASYLINGDASGLEPDEIAAADSFVAECLEGSAAVSCEPAGFVRTPDSFRVYPYSATCERYASLVPRNVA